MFFNSKPTSTPTDEEMATLRLAIAYFGIASLSVSMCQHLSFNNNSLDVINSAIDAYLLKNHQSGRCEALDDQQCHNSLDIADIKRRVSTTIPEIMQSLADKILTKANLKNLVINNYLQSSVATQEQLLDGIKILSAALKRHSGIEVIVFNKADLHTSAIKQLVSALMAKKSISLSLSSALSTDSVEEIAKLLKANVLKSLSLQSSSISVDGLMHIANSLENNFSLEKLTLKIINVTADDWTRFKNKVVTSNCILREIKLNDEAREQELKSLFNNAIGMRCR